MKTKLLALAVAILAPLTCLAPYHLTWQPNPTDDITITGYRIYVCTNSLAEAMSGAAVTWELYGTCDVNVTNFFMTIENRRPPVRIIGISQLTTNGEGYKALLPVIPPPTNAFYKTVP